MHHNAPIDISDLNAPPASTEAEQSVIGGILLRNEAWDEIYDIVRPQHFYVRAHSVIFDAFGSLYESQIPVDVVTLSEELEKRDKLDSVGGLAYLADLVRNTPSTANIKAYASIVKERATLRNMIAISHEVIDECYQSTKSANEIIEIAESKIVKVSESTIREGGPVHVDIAMKQAVDEIDRLFNSDEEFSGLSTGFSGLDKKTAGLQDGDLVIVAGRPSMGKTAFVTCIAENIVIDAQPDDNKGAVLFFSLEMPKQQLMHRVLSSLGRIPHDRVRSGKLLEEDWPGLSTAVSKIAKKPFWIDDTGGLTPNEMRTRARKISREFGGLRMIVVDYLQLMRVPELIQNPTAEISEISKALKNLAKEHSCPVIALSQLNRDLEKRQSKRPVLSDLRQSGQIEQDADLIMFIHRDEYFDEETDRQGIADIIIAKQRNGPLCDVPVSFQGQYTRFEDLPPSYYN